MPLHHDSPLILFLHDSFAGVAMRGIPWLFPSFEVLHFFGMALLVGAVGVIDLRVLGFARGLPLMALHRFQPIGVGGLVINIITGIGFVASDPLPYLMNGAFRLKLLLMLVAGLNILIFYFVLPREARQLQANASAPIPARLVAAASLLLWFSVIWAGRFIAFTGKNTL
jgi:hypothetical protein